MTTTPPTGPGTWGSSESPSELHLGAEAVKVLAHPLRSRIVTQLRRSGPLTATALAALLGTNSGATSYHLQVSKDFNFTTLTVDQTGIMNLFVTPSTTLQSGTTYYWRVYAVNGGGSTLATPSPLFFKTS
jgi:DNA-binding transcriptional ArsR family regulator